MGEGGGGGDISSSVDKDIKQSKQLISRIDH